jgi:hypothetical protein
VLAASIIRVMRGSSHLLKSLCVLKSGKYVNFLLQLRMSVSADFGVEGVQMFCRQAMSVAAHL